ncbi:MAG: hypothetical protein K8T90_22150 [Planctomycetes bacterium]|nr:hypothetical protein [Planctomycetota bacterium]
MTTKPNVRGGNSRFRKLLACAIAVTAAVSLGGCRSPFSDWDESGPPADPQKVGAGVHGWPLYERDPGAGGVRTDVLWPMASVRTNDDGTVRRASLLIPIVLWERDGTRERFGIRPLFDVESDSREGGRISDVDLLFPIVKWRDAPDEHVFQIRPIWWSRWKDTTQGRDEYTVLAPFWGTWTNPQGHGSFVFPLYGENTHGTDSVRWYAAGLVILDEDEAKSLEGTKLLLGALESTTWNDGSAWRVFPFVWHSEDASKNANETFLLWPGLAGWTRNGDDRTSWAFPVWYHNEDADEKTTLLVPFWYSNEKGEGDAQSWTRVLFPIYGSQKEPGLERTFWGGNLYIDTTTADGGATDIVWPIFHTGTDATGWDSRLFPFVWLDRHPDRGHTHVWPLFGHEWNGTKSTSSVAWPFFTLTTASNGWEAWLPAPFVNIDRRGDDHETTVFPLFHHESNASKGTYEGNVLGLVANWEGTGGKAPDADAVATPANPPAKPTSDFRILWRLVQDTETGDRHVFAVNPLFRHETNARGDDHWSALFGLVARTREADDVNWRFLWFLNL